MIITNDFFCLQVSGLQKHSHQCQEKVPKNFFRNKQAPVSLGASVRTEGQTGPLGCGLARENSETVETSHSSGIQNEKSKREEARGAGQKNGAHREEACKPGCPLCTLPGCPRPAFHPRFSPLARNRPYKEASRCRGLERGLWRQVDLSIQLAFQIFL